MNGEVYIHKYPKLKVRVVDGSRLAAAVVINSLPKATTNVVMTGNLTKVAYTIAYALCQRGVQVVFFSFLKKSFACCDVQWKKKMIGFFIFYVTWRN